MTSDFDRLDRILDRLHALERSIPMPHERSIAEVARTALFEAASDLAHRLGRHDYWRHGRIGAVARIAS